MTGSFVQQDGPSALDEQLLTSLHRHGAQTVEQLVSSLPGGSWAQVFLSIDRLSRSGAVSLQRTDSRGYQVSVSQVAA